ncbi:MAG: bifunctional diaminohydroxyphosphoribosylaminopyrimidine deaminase/5-amino-6-(5-phosphoribosylamino)uracil reductase RibD [Thiothrix sp.]|nr:MAG: bifunctional diaminohydroxyphosphoribosylaminopyrimidine deaminase/5-amino-6-(5-phosphoribosylamino)uracil reductase RibD [Thiothrix sp.]
MARAMCLAEKGLYSTRPNPRVGCVIVKNGEVVGEGFHISAGGPHAEIHALKKAGAAAQGSTVYVTLEPCSHYGRTPPCADALIEAGVRRVIAAMSDPNPQVAGKGLERLRAAGVEVSSGLLESQAVALNPGFTKRMRCGRPWLRVKLAMSLDGRTAMASGESQWITGEAARKDVQSLRARSCAILTGAGTVREDNPSLNVRNGAKNLSRPVADGQPLRVILSSRGENLSSSKLFDLDGNILIFCASDMPDSIRERANVECLKIASDSTGLDLNAVMDELGRRGINECHVEAGATLSGALLEAGLVDEIIIYMAPLIMGDQARGLFHLPEIQTMAQRIPMRISDIRAVGNDWRITAQPLYS